MSQGVIRCKAAVAFEAGQPLRVVEIEVDPPKAHEVRLRVLTSGVCHTDLYTLSGKDPEGKFPCILGHEGGCVVESIGADVTSCKRVCPQVGDRVVPLYTAECRECKFCKSGKTNLCGAVREMQGKGLMQDGTTRFRYDGKPVYHFMGCSTFSEFTVVNDVSVAVMPSKARMDLMCLLGCGVTTGIGAALNTAKVSKGSTVAIFGLGVIGLSCILGCKMAGAERILGVDMSADKEKMAREFGMTDFVNPKDLKEGEKIQEKIISMTDGGVDYSFECVGNVDLMRSALECCHKGWGECTIIGVAASGQEISTRPFQLVTGRVWRGSAFGGVRGRTELPEYAKKAQNGEIPLERFISHRTTFDRLPEIPDIMAGGKCLRAIAYFDAWEEMKTP